MWARAVWALPGEPRMLIMRRACASERATRWWEHMHMHTRAGMTADRCATRNLHELGFRKAAPVRCACTSEPLVSKAALTSKSDKRNF